MKITNKKNLSFLLTFILFSMTVLYFYGLLTTQGSIPGFGLDPFFCMFVIHTNALKIFSGDFSGIVNLPFFYPKGNTLAFSDPLIFHSIFYGLLFKFLGIKDLSIRLMFFGFFILNWLGCSFFLYNIKKRMNISIFVGWLFAFSLFFQVQSAHYQNLIVFPIFLSIVTLLSSRLSNSQKFIFSFLGTFIMIISNLYFFIYGLILFFSIGILFLIYKGKNFLIKSKYSFLGTFLAGIVAIPLIQYYFSVRLEFPEIVGVRNFDEKIFFSARPWDYFKVLYPPLIYFNLKEYFISHEFERSNFSGLIGIFTFSIITILFFIHSNFKRLKLQIISILLFTIGVFLVSGPLILTTLYKLVSHIVPGLSEIRAVGRAGLIINIAYAISIFIFLTKFKKKNFMLSLLLLFYVVLSIGERITTDFPTRYVQYELPIHKEALQLIEDKNIEKINTKSILVITETIEDFIRLPFYLSIESGIQSVNGYSGYNPFEWNHINLFFSKTPDCNKLKKRNNYLFKNANFLLVEKQSPIFKKCISNLSDFKLSSQSKNLYLFENIL